MNHSPRHRAASRTPSCDSGPSAPVAGRPGRGPVVAVAAGVWLGSGATLLDGLGAAVIVGRTVGIGPTVVLGDGEGTTDGLGEGEGTTAFPVEPRGARGADGSVTARGGTLSGLVAEGEARRAVNCFGELDSTHSAAVQGAYLDGLTYEALAQKFDVPINTLRTWLRRSLLKLRECLDR